MFQGCKSELMFVLIAGDSHVNFGCTFIVGQPDVGNSDCAQPRILELIPNNLSNLLANRIRYSFRTMHLSITTVPGAHVRRTLVCRASRPTPIELTKAISSPTHDKLKFVGHQPPAPAPAYCSCS